ncbi:MAG: potassium channel family protein [Muribaculum sp.]|nr:potassium channel family protein [Muribaculum sp.]
MWHTLSNKTRHFFHVVSNIRPVVWIGLYVALTPVFALIYMWLPDSQFRIPDGAGTDFGSWLYYSIVTITTLGFGDYTPAHGWAQAVTAVEVMCGLILLGFFLNAVGSMKSEIDVESEIEKQRAVHFATEREKLLKITPSVMHNLNMFLAYCYAVTTPVAKRDDSDARYNPDFSFKEMTDMFKPSGLPYDRSRKPAAERLMKSAAQTSLVLDSLHQRVDLTLWEDIVDDCFAFVANYQMFSSTDTLSETPQEEARIAKEIATVDGSPEFKPESELYPIAELYYFIKDNASIAAKLETALASIALRHKE